MALARTYSVALVGVHGHVIEVRGPWHRAFVNGPARKFLCPLEWAVVETPLVKLGLLGWMDGLRCAHLMVAESTGRVTAVTRCGHEGRDLGERGRVHVPFAASRIMSGFGWFGLYQTIQKSILSSIRRAP